MVHIITAVGILMCALALVGLAAPAAVTGLASRVAGSGPLRVAAIAARIIFGAVAILAAEQTLYPWPMKILGVISIMAGTVVGMIDAGTLNRWVEMIKSGSGRARAVSLAALVVGAFLVHASV
ncbi:MAG: hypothetical protein U5R46_07890 [Gammaproteobacteria bacterium]|nr:hypothetical protein [Gammaproteobacteria bacterium]